MSPRNIAYLVYFLFVTTIGLWFINELRRYRLLGIQSGTARIEADIARRRRKIYLQPAA